ncbi:hypothetical protein [Actinacidiphila acididurans]|uniref:Uncharacterized protein n=1 Tax=Actinacidiphila acididurans TaxID=2784346 RepID=A0ABS2U4H8_9ACTN|nr:hypothetical protein [Actinacidiphila acididurans]MBM9510061.1 hypothetical protein [Actinacidiphila acididurans]
MTAPTITAPQLPAIRAELAEWLTDTGPNGGPVAWSEGFDGQTAVQERANAGRWAASLRAAELFFVATDMTRLAVAAGEALPAYRLHPEELPAQHGLLMWEEPVNQGLRGGEATTAPVIAVTWAVRTGGVAVRTWVHREDWLTYMAEGDARAGIRDLTPDEVRAVRQRYPQPITAMAETWLPFGKLPGWLFSAPPPGLSLYEQEDRARTLGWLQQVERALVVTWLLMGQTLATARDIEPPRSAVKFIRRIDPGMLAATRYVQLRHRGFGPEAQADAGGPGRTYQHRWLVRGHWRNHWYPSRQDHRPIWINTHVKGPNGAPLLDPDKLVNILRR